MCVGIASFLIAEITSVSRKNWMEGRMNGPMIALTNVVHLSCNFISSLRGGGEEKRKKRGRRRKNKMVLICVCSNNVICSILQSPVLPTNGNFRFTKIIFNG